MTSGGSLDPSGGLLDPVLTALSGAFALAQQGLFEQVFQPLLFSFGMGNLLEEGYDAAGWLLVGLLQIVVMLALIGPLQRWRPFEADPGSLAERARRRADILVDVVYTLIDRLGLMRLVLFFAVEPVSDALFGALAIQGIAGWQADQWIAPWWPGITDTPLAGFVLYLLLLDGLNYLIHRAQHRFNWWWALHAVHHSQRHMTMWTDSRNHLLDQLITGVIFVLVSRLIGVPPAQFVALVAVSQLLESLSHANARVGFGWLGDRLLVGPRFHRLHHGIGIGHESAGVGSLGGCNFSVLFPIWDLLLRTARYGGPVQPTGIRDQLPQEGGRDYGRGFWAQQWLGLGRLARAFAPASGINRA